MNKYYKIAIFFGNVLALSGFFAYIILFFSNNIKGLIMNALLVFLLVPSLILNYSYIWTAKKTEKNAMMEL